MNRSPALPRRPSAMLPDALGLLPAWLGSAPQSPPSRKSPQRPGGQPARCAVTPGWAAAFKQADPRAAVTFPLARAAAHCSVRVKVCVVALLESLVLLNTGGGGGRAAAEEGPALVIPACQEPQKEGRWVSSSSMYVSALEGFAAGPPCNAEAHSEEAGPPSEAGLPSGVGAVRGLGRVLAGAKSHRAAAVGGGAWGRGQARPLLF